MKQDTSTQIVIGDNCFFIRPFPALKAATMAATVGKVIGPVLGRVSPALSAFLDGTTKSNSIQEAAMNIDIDVIFQSFGNALSELDPDALEKVLRMLLFQHNNIAYRAINSVEMKMLTEDETNEIFCQNVEDMYVLAVKVVSINFPNIIGKLLGQSGIRIEDIKKSISENMARLRQTDSATQNSDATNSQPQESAPSKNSRQQ